MMNSFRNAPHVDKNRIMGLHYIFKFKVGLHLLVRKLQHNIVIQKTRSSPQFVTGFVMFVWHEISSSNISKIVWRRITKFYRDIHTDIVYSHTGHGIITYFRSAVIEKGLSWDHEILHTYWSQSASQTCRKWHNQLLLIGIHRGSKIGWTFRFACIKSNAVSKASSNFSSEEYRQCFRIKRPGVSPRSTL